MPKGIPNLTRYPNYRLMVLSYYSAEWTELEVSLCSMPYGALDLTGSIGRQARIGQPGQPGNFWGEVDEVIKDCWKRKMNVPKAASQIYVTLKVLSGK